ncbi:MAG: N-acetyl-gamma-glutamyl-phosphate reductase [Candidatus Methanomethylophilaceae archaeon]|nr:N-acetyl-gamma-glutamyl-phosphate reductase [Candidatus Methanomethylophilaceae archaeon]
MKNIGIIGGTGYTGGELARILSMHQNVNIAAMTSRQNAGLRVSSLQPNLKGYTDIEFTESIPDSVDVDLVFVATPHGAAMKLIPGFMERGIKAIDLSGDYRLHDILLYEKWYGHEHTDPENLENAVYGLPEFYRDSIKKADLVANPGCYATSAILPLAPLVRSGLTEGPIFIDGKSGTSGAGMNPSQRLHHPTCGESVIPYSVGLHRHTPEIETVVGDISGKDTSVLFVPHLVPIIRGIISTCYFRFAEEVGQEKLDALYSKAYDSEFFVDYVKEPSIRAVVASNHAQVASHADGVSAVAFGVLDNLVKGASGQAVQCMNLMLGLEETEGLKAPGLGV